jgi:FkbM family methyltransferase
MGAFFGITDKVAGKIRKLGFVRYKTIPGGRDTDRLEYLGTRYGGWWLDTAMTNEITPSDVVISCGAGEDLSFDLGLQKRTGCTIVIVDPTPRAVAHYAQLRDAAARGGTIAINDGPGTYDAAGVDFAKLILEPLAIWNCDESLTLWFPVNPSHVSLSVMKNRDGQERITVPATTIAGLVKKYSISRLPLIKLDVENAEVTVVNDIIERGIRPRQLALEIDELNFPGAGTMARVRDLTERLSEYGYVARHFDGEANFLFVDGRPDPQIWRKRDSARRRVDPSFYPAHGRAKTASAHPNAERMSKQRSS